MVGAPAPSYSSAPQHDWDPTDLATKKSSNFFQDTTASKLLKAGADRHSPCAWPLRFPTLSPEPCETVCEQNLPVSVSFLFLSWRLCPSPRACYTSCDLRCTCACHHPTGGPDSAPAPAELQGRPEGFSPALTQARQAGKGHSEGSPWWRAHCHPCQPSPRVPSLARLPSESAEPGVSRPLQVGRVDGSPRWSISLHTVLGWR